MSGVHIINLRNGYKIVYSPTNRMFYLHDSEDKEVHHAKTQEQCEVMAEKLIKVDWDRWKVISGAKLAEITSFNPETGTGWIVWDGAAMRRESFDPSYRKAYPRSPENMAILERLKALRAEDEVLSREMLRLEKSLAGELTLKDFEEHIKASKKAPSKKRGGTKDGSGS